MKDKSKKSIYKRSLFLLTIVSALLMLMVGCGVKEGIEDGVNDTLNSTQSEAQSNSEFDDIKFVPLKVRNDSTGNWRYATIAENIDIQDYALDYYKKYFESDDEVHFILNYNYNTTTRINKLANLLVVTVHERVDKEQNDAKTLCSGMMLKEYHVNMETGEVEEIQ